MILHHIYILLECIIWNCELIGDFSQHSHLHRHHYLVLSTSLIGFLIFFFVEGLLRLEPLILFSQGRVLLVFLGYIIKLKSVLSDSAETARALSQPIRTALLWTNELLIYCLNLYIINLRLILVLLLLVVDVIILLFTNAVIVKVVILLKLLWSGRIFIIWI